MGEIVFWTIMRTAITIPLVWLLQCYMDVLFWWVIVLFSIYGVIIHPAIIHSRLFEEKNKDVIESTLCSSCQHFDKTAVLCLKHDKHPTKDTLPCDGIDWEPKAFKSSEDEIISGG